jgi:heat shock protein HtpX
LPLNLLEQQAANRRRTWAVMVLFAAFLALIGYGFDRYFLGMEGIGIPLGSVAGLAFGSVSALSSYYGGDRAVLASAGAIPLEQALGSAPDEAGRFKLSQVQHVVEEMAIAAGLPVPRVYIIPDADPNAFATGRDPQHASVAVTSGLVDMLSREELQGVVAHELSHVRNLDIRLMMVVAALVGAIVLLSDWASRGLFYGSPRARRRSRDKEGGGGLPLILFAVWVVGIILAPLIGQSLAMMVSRRREYLADASGAELTRNPLALAGALEKIEEASAPTSSVKRGTAHLCIADPLGRPAGLREGFWADLFASHPPMAKRIAALREMAYQSASSG